MEWEVQRRCVIYQCCITLDLVIGYYILLGGSRIGFTRYPDWILSPIGVVFPPLTIGHFISMARAITRGTSPHKNVGIYSLR